jgi:hypothetical protein
LNLDRWFLRQVEVSVRKGPRGDKTADCVDQTFLRSYAEQPAGFSLADDRVDHVTSCGYCMGCLLELRAAEQAKTSRGLRYVAVAWLGLAVLVAGGIVAFVLHHWQPAAAPVQLVELRRTLDLSQYLAHPADQPPINTPLHLPAAVLRLELVLPQKSQPGVYEIAIAANGNDGVRVARAEGNSTGADPRTAVTVSLDLRNAAPGTYVLSTRLVGANASHIYPLEIDPLTDR